MILKIDVAPGELIDKITILEIKLERISEPDKRRNVDHEYAVLRAVLDGAVTPSLALAALHQQLKTVNEAVWDHVAGIHEHELRQDFGASYTELARLVYRDNDRRAALKRQINELLDSDLIEEKSFSVGYQPKA